MLKTSLDRHPLEPPEGGLLRFEIQATPVSLQGASEKKRELKDLIRKKTRSVQYLLSGEIKVDIEWLVHERDRYESPAAPDLDNILKPMLDALKGPGGLMFDDCQVQEVSCRWVDINTPTNLITFELKFIQGDFVSKQGLVFVHVGNRLYIPLNTSLNPNGQLIILKTWEGMFALRDTIQKETGDYYGAKQVLPTQRVFHGARLAGFPKIELNELKRVLVAQLGE